ncbi:hypothetical protein EDD11_006756 [Mortierella claussenii]|nr:hypothetical protein EDD11_006756 [Mortierella claussenii]
MDFARKSIMQRATASPQSAIRKIQQVAAENNGAPSLMDLLTASDAKDVSDSQQARQSQQQYLSAQKLEQSFAKSDTPFTFESTPLPSSDNNRTSLPSSNTLVRSFLDFSDREEQQQREDMSLSRTFKQAPTSAGDDGTKEQDDSNRVDQKVMEHATLDLRAANLGDPLTAQQDLDNRRSAFLPRASMSQRPAPYTRPTVNERETLRANRAPHFRARPLDPKVFTSAGDLGVPRIRKLPLTIPVSPVFSKPRVKATSTIGTRPARTLTSARLTNLNKQQPDRRPVSHSNPAGAKGTRFEAQPGASGTGTDSDAGGSRKTMHSVSRPNQYLVNSAIDTHESSNLISNSSNKPKSAAMTAIYPSKPESQAALQGMSQSSSSRLSSGASMHKIIRGPPIRGEGATALTTTPAQSSDEHSKEPVVAEVAAVALRHSRAAPLLRRPLTQPVPFKFATDDILRRRRAMFQPRTASNPASQGVVSSSALRTTQIGKPKAAPVQRHPQPRLKRLTVPIPFQLATQRRAEIHNHYHHHDQPQQQRTRGDNGNEVLASIRLRRTSRLAGMPSLRSSLQASGEILPPGAATTGAIMGHKVRRSHFVPTIPISPKLGRHVPVAALGPTRFLLKKSTKELTQPHEFHFHSDDRAREREALEKSAVSRQQELEKLKNNAAIRLNKEREQRLRVRESMERTFRARPIRHYQPTTIHKSTIPLTKPVSPNIGEKRKRHEMEQQQQQEWKQFEQSLHSQDHPTQNPPLRQPVQHQNQQQYYMTDLDASVGQDMYQQFEEAKILQEEHHVLQQELSRQERRQLELANSPQATIHQPPIRLSFPLDPTLQADETQGGGGGPTSNDQNEGQQHQQMNVIPPLPPVIRDSFGGSNNHHLSRELRRISLEASRGSSGNYRQRLSDIASRSSGSGGANRRSESGGRSSSEGRTSSGDGNYYPFTRSQAPTASTHADAPSTLTTGKATEQDAENRRRSGSFIPLNMSAAEAPVNKRTIRDSPPPSRVSRLFGAPAVSLASAQLNRSKGPEVIDHRLSLSDL